MWAERRKQMLRSTSEAPNTSSGAANKSECTANVTEGKVNTASGFANTSSGVANTSSSTANTFEFDFSKPLESGDSFYTTSTTDPSKTGPETLGKRQHCVPEVLDAKGNQCELSRHNRSQNYQRESDLDLDSKATWTPVSGSFNTRSRKVSQQKNEWQPDPDDEGERRGCAGLCFDCSFMCKSNREIEDELMRRTYRNREQMKKTNELLDKMEQEHADYLTSAQKEYERLVWAKEDFTYDMKECDREMKDIQKKIQKLKTEQSSRLSRSSRPSNSSETASMWNKFFANKNRKSKISKSLSLSPMVGSFAQKSPQKSENQISSHLVQTDPNSLKIVMS